MTLVEVDARTGPTLLVRPLARQDIDEVQRIDAVHTGTPKTQYWTRIFDAFFDTRGPLRIGLAADAGDRLAGYLLGEVRAFEFGSEACGWIFAVAVDPPFLERHVASKLLAEACRQFRGAGVDRVRTMVRRNDVPVLAFFRANGFTGGPFVQLELDLEEIAAWPS